MKKQFLQIQSNITRCTYTPLDGMTVTSLFFDPKKMKGTPVQTCPIEYADRSCTVKYLPFPERA